MRSLPRIVIGVVTAGSLVAAPLLGSSAAGGQPLGAAGVCFPPGERPAVDGPSPRRGMGMANDAARKQVVLFGGWDGVSHFGDTWTWDGTSWTERHPAHAPSARRSHGMVYDAARREVVLFGGTPDGIITLADTWTWDGTDWTEEHPLHPPLPNSIFGMAFDAGTRKVVMNGGSGFAYYTTWLWDGSDWEEIYQIGRLDWRELQGMSRDGNHVLMFGGETEYFETFWLTRTTFTWDGATWRQRQPAHKPSARDAMGMAYDVERNEVVLFGGAAYGGPLADTWTWNGTDWTKESPPSRPLPRERMGMAYDSARRQMVLFGGTQNSDECFFGDTWTWDGVTWTER
jgi:hypothetical protein